MTYEFGSIILVLAADLGFTLVVGVRIVPELRRDSIGSLRLLSHLWLPSARPLSSEEEFGRGRAEIILSARNLKFRAGALLVTSLPRMRKQSFK